MGPTRRGFGGGGGGGGGENSGGSYPCLRPPNRFRPEPTGGGRNEGFCSSAGLDKNAPRRRGGLSVVVSAAAAAAAAGGGRGEVGGGRVGGHGAVGV